MNEAPESSPQQTVTVPLNKDLSDLIPFEIFEYIISLLPNHLPTLKNCTLTCRAWLQPSWKRLFAGRIVLVHRKNIDRLLEIIERNAHSDSLTIIRFIERVAIEQGGSSRLIRNEGNQERNDLNQIFQFDEFLPRFVGFTSVRWLRLGWVRGDTGTPTTLSLQNNFGERITGLELNSVILRSPSQFFDILHALPRLASLTLVGLKLNSGRPNEEAAGIALVNTPKPPQLQELYCNVSEGIADFIFSWIAFHGSIPIRTLAVGLFTQSCNSKLSRFLVESGSTLEAVKIWDAIVPTNFDLSPCTRMRVLKMGWINISSSSPAGSETFVTDILQTVNAQYLEEVTVVLQILVSNTPGVESDLGAFDWVGLASILQRPQFKNLRKFCFSVSSHALVFKQALVKSIGPAAASGKLSFNVFQVVEWSRTEFGGQW